MLKTLTAAAIALTATLVFGSTANSAGCLNCGYYNGVSLNGIHINGFSLNGFQINGVQINGVRANGQVWNGVHQAGAAKDQLAGGMKVLAVELPAAR